MENKTTKINLSNFIILGILCSLFLFIAETIISFFAGNKISIAFFLLSIIIYLFIGIIISLIVFISTKIINRDIPESRYDIINLLKYNAVIPIGLILIYGIFLINSLVFTELSIFNISSLISDIIWLGFCIILYFIYTKFIFKNHFLFRTKIVTGYFLTTIGLAIIAHNINMVRSLEYDWAIFQFFKMFIISLVCLWLGYFIVSKSKLIWEHKTFRAIVFIGIICVFVIFAVKKLILNGGVKDLKPNKKPNVILLVLDTQRADHLSCYGYSRKTSPNIDKFSTEAAKFKKCYSTANWTVPGHASIFTGKYLITLGCHCPGVSFMEDKELGKKYVSFPLIDEELTFAEILKENGYQTAAVISNTGNVTKFNGLHQGFEHWDTKDVITYKTFAYILLNKIQIKIKREIIELFYNTLYRNATDINKAIYKWLDKRKEKPFFLFVNYNDPHSPYRPPSPYDTKFPGKMDNFNLMKVKEEVMSQKRKITKAEKNHLLSQYDGEILYLDNELGKLFARLKNEGLYDNSIIIITSDHGEHFGEHDLIEHGNELYDPVTSVPLIIKPSKNFEWNPVVDQTVQVIDILPTILEMLDIEIPEDIQGSPLTKRISHPIISEDYMHPVTYNKYNKRFHKDQMSLVEEDFKYISSTDNNNKLFNLNTDTDEIKNLKDINPEKSKFLYNKIMEWRDSVKVRKLDGKMLPELDPENLQKLRALGYIK